MSHTPERVTIKAISMRGESLLQIDGRSVQLPTTTCQDIFEAINNCSLLKAAPILLAALRHVSRVHYSGYLMQEADYKIVDAAIAAIRE
jgi:hypothetical protein